jgi:hypothetical protein
MSEEISILRLYLLRVLYLFIFVLLGSDVWPRIIHHKTMWEPLTGVAFSFWAESASGIR